MQNLSIKNLDVINTTKGTVPSVPFVKIKQAILPDDYELSITFVSPAKIKSFSVQYKGDDTHKDILSFPLSKNVGEMILNLNEIKKSAKFFDRTYEEHLKFLVIHGTLHLAGMRHGSKMETEEKRLMREIAF
jgi:probable rRNA maturation factor